MVYAEFSWRLRNGPSEFLKRYVVPLFEFRLLLTRMNVVYEEVQVAGRRYWVNHPGLLGL